jgi:hypothetical protein
MRFPALVAVLSPLAAVCAVGVAWAADPLVSVGPPGGTAASGAVDSNGKSDACLDQAHSGTNQSAAAATDVVRIADRSCASGSGASFGGTATATASPTTRGTEERCELDHDQHVTFEREQVGDDEPPRRRLLGNNGDGVGGGRARRADRARFATSSCRRSTAGASAWW